MATKIIEYVCTGNQGRSPVAEAIGRTHLRDIRVNLREIDTASSGTGVNMMKGWQDGFLVHPVDPKWAETLITLGLKRGGVFKDFSDVYTEEDYRRWFNTWLAKGEMFKAVHMLTVYALNFFNKEEREHRTQAARKFNLGSIKDTPENTVVRPNAAVILGMTNGNVEVVNEIYAKVESKPHIDTLRKYAIGEEAQGIPDAFGLGIKIYFEMVEALRDCTRRSVDKTLDALLRG